MAELLSAWAPRISRATLIPGSGGVFDVRLDGELLFCKTAENRHARPGEVHALVAARLGPPIDRDAFHGS